MFWLIVAVYFQKNNEKIYHILPHLSSVGKFCIVKGIKSSLPQKLNFAILP